MNLPESMEVVCCWPGKSCGTSTVVLHADAELRDGEAVKVWSYVRDTNGDVYMGLGPTTDPAELARVYDYTPAAAERYLQGER